MESKDQKQVWNNIAPDWYKFKTTSDPIVDNFVKKTKGNLLDLGCGSGRNFLKSNITIIIYGLDFSEEMIKFAAKKAKKLNLITDLKVHDIIKKLPFKNNFFNSAICIATLHCIEGKENRIKILKELHRVLKPKAKLLIKVWNKNNKKFKNKGNEKLISWRDKGARYYYFYTAEELVKELKKTGFKILEANSKDKKTGFENKENSLKKEFSSLEKSTESKKIFPKQEIVILCRKQ